MFAFSVQTIKPHILAMTIIRASTEYEKNVDIVCETFYWYPQFPPLLSIPMGITSDEILKVYNISDMDLAIEYERNHSLNQKDTKSQQFSQSQQQQQQQQQREPSYYTQHNTAKSYYRRELLENGKIVGLRVYMEAHLNKETSVC